MFKNYQMIILEIWNEPKMEFVISVRDQQMLRQWSSLLNGRAYQFIPFLVLKTVNMCLEMRSLIYKRFRILLRNI